MIVFDLFPEILTGYDRALLAAPQPARLLRLVTLARTPAEQARRATAALAAGKVKLIRAEVGR